jgi:hypothetical protein
MTMSASIAIKGRIGMMTLALAVACLPAPAFAAVQIKASASGRVLTIAGDRAADEVVVEFSAARDAIEVSANAIPLGSFAAGPLESIRVRLGGGDDSLSVQLASGGLLGLRTLSVNLGGGDDFAHLDVDPGVFRTVIGGSGEDTVSGRSDVGLRAVENFVTPTALISNGGTSLDYTCHIVGGEKECLCDPSNPPDCLLMGVNECTPASLDALIECVRNASPLFLDYCWCPQRSALVGGTPPIFRVPTDELSR